MAEYQARKFSRIPGCTVTGCIDHHPEHGESFARRMGIPFYYVSVKEMLDAGTCNALSCVVADSRHYECCAAALEYAMPVLCEKPLTRTLKEAEDLRRRALQFGGPAMVNFSKRNAPALSCLKQILDEGRLGLLVKVNAEYLQGWAATKVWGDWHTTSRWKWRLMPDAAAAGAAGDLGSHLADALLFLFGGLSVDAVRGIRLKEAMETGRLREEKLEAEFAGGGAWVEIEARGNLPGVDGAVPAHIRASWIVPEALDDFRITVDGTRARAVLDFRKSREGVELFEPGAGEDPALCKNGRFLAGIPAASSYELFAEAVERHIAGDRRPVNPAAGDFSFEQGLRVQRILNELVPGGLPR
jgi:predicted dehydrogenase